MGTELRPDRVKTIFDGKLLFAILSELAQRKRVSLLKVNNNVFANFHNIVITINFIAYKVRMKNSSTP